jgi:hypothetical protein
MPVTIAVYWYARVHMSYFRVHITVGCDEIPSHSAVYLQ